MLGIHVEYECNILYTLNKYKDIDIIQTYIDIDKLEKDNVNNVTNKLFYIHLPCNYNNMYEYTIKNVQRYVNILNNINSVGVLHIGNNNKYGNIINIGNNLNNICNMNKNKILLENSAGQGCDLGYNFEQLRKLYEILDHNNFGFCLDTQHSFASGLCEFNDANDVDKLFEELYNFNKFPNLIHLNDSKTKYNSHVDRHENLGIGYIWKDNKTSLYRLLDYTISYNINIILETPKSNIMIDYNNIKNIYNYKNK